MRRRLSEFADLIVGALLVIFALFLLWGHAVRSEDALATMVGALLGSAALFLGNWITRWNERRRQESEAANFRKGISDELVARTAQLVVARTAIATALREGFPPALDAIAQYVKITPLLLFRNAGDRLYLLTEAQRAALLALDDALDNYLRQFESTREFGWQNMYMWPQQCTVLHERCQDACAFGAEALAEMRGRDKQQPRESQLREVAYVDNDAQMGASAAIGQHKRVVQQRQPQPGPPVSASPP
jgi:hypothetical protein